MDLQFPALSHGSVQAFPCPGPRQVLCLLRTARCWALLHPGPSCSSWARFSQPCFPVLAAQPSSDFFCSGLTSCLLTRFLQLVFPCLWPGGTCSISSACIPAVFPYFAQPVLCWYLMVFFPSLCFLSWLSAPSCVFLAAHRNHLSDCSSRVHP